MQQLGFQVVFACVLTGAQHHGRGLHGAHMRPGRNFPGAPENAHLVRVLEEAHLVKQLAQVVLRLRALGPHAHAGAHLA